MFKQHKHLLIGVVIIGVLIVACQSQMVSPTWSPLVSESPIDLLRGGKSAIPAMPTPHPGYGVVVGRLVTDSPMNLVGLSVFLGDAIVLEGGPHAAFLNRQIAPVGRVDSTTGWFVFDRVNPGLYTLVVSEPELGSWVYMQDGDVKIIEVTAGQVVNLGEMLFNR